MFAANAYKKYDNSKSLRQNANLSEQSKRFAFPKLPFLSRAWKVGKYYNGSGNSKYMQRVESEPTILTPRTSNTTKSLTPVNFNSKYHANTETERNLNSNNGYFSMINVQKVRYDPITNVPITMKSATTCLKRKEIETLMREEIKYNRKLNPQYQEALSKNPKVFFRRSGEFTKFDDMCVQKNGGNPFYHPLSLNKNK